jgi:hypothetical protein
MESEPPSDSGITWFPGKGYARSPTAKALVAVRLAQLLPLR